MKRSWLQVKGSGEILAPSRVIVAPSWKAWQVGGSWGPGGSKLGSLGSKFGHLGAKIGFHTSFLANPKDDQFLYVFKSFSTDLEGF